MPFESKAQQRFMHAKHPEIAKRWDKETPSFKSLPEHKNLKKQIVEKIKKRRKH